MSSVQTFHLLRRELAVPRPEPLASVALTRLSPEMVGGRGMHSREARTRRAHQSLTRKKLWRAPAFFGEQKRQPWRAHIKRAIRTGTWGREWGGAGGRWRREGWRGRVGRERAREGEGAIYSPKYYDEEATGSRQSLTGLSISVSWYSSWVPMLARRAINLRMSCAHILPKVSPTTCLQKSSLPGYRVRARKYT